MDQLTPDQARALFAHGAKVVVSDAPSNLVLGIDWKSWQLGPRFRGIKLVPPGVHLLHHHLAVHGTPNPMRHGRFLTLGPGEVCGLRWDREHEALVPEDPDQVERFRLGIHALDPQLGAYPLLESSDAPHPGDGPPARGSHVDPGQEARGHEARGTWDQWCRLTSCLQDDAALDALLPGRTWSSTDTIAAVPPPADLGGLIAPHSAPAPERTVAATDVVETVAGSPLRLRPIHLKASFPPDASPADRTRWSLDKSWLLRQTLAAPVVPACSRTALERQEQRERAAQRMPYRTVPPPAAGVSDGMRALVAELQLAFVAFMVGSIYDGFEAWKHRVALVALSTDWITASGHSAGSDPIGSDLAAFLEAWSEQMTVFPVDWFMDHLARDNFLADCLYALGRAAQAADPEAPWQPALKRLAAYMRGRFGVDFMAASREDPREAWQPDVPEAEFRPNGLTPQALLDAVARRQQHAHGFDDDDDDELPQVVMLDESGS
ncbi:hypothetical protein CXG81DRAFT_19805 [Caulochytrium protostelioides]|uniref:AAR2-domain-containing protein n=1 Tax=Caulochytrium protostelioides TaxID=1555241 RepID=A0A4P9X530_9FUNG|nr:hypothetical protein CXG81DRAFT_19805 [Caulochytrium protostelioides]|eukprot:RKP00216.1 hypothetical protein CXG81DRAFT_19805 [Caulochytrium protostelioides]